MQQFIDATMTPEQAGNLCDREEHDDADDHDADRRQIERRSEFCFDIAKAKVMN
jgi:hypothetical protein